MKDKINRKIAFITHEVKEHKKEYIIRSLDLLQNDLSQYNINIDYDFIGELRELNKKSKVNSPNSLPSPFNGGYDPYPTADILTKFQVEWMPFLKEYSDLSLLVDRPMYTFELKEFDPNLKKESGLNIREVFGMAHLFGRPFFRTFLVGLDAVDRLEGDYKQKYVDFVLKHELGHIWGGFPDLKKDHPGKENIMKGFFGDLSRIEHMTTEYRPEQIEAIKERLKLDRENKPHLRLETSILYYILRVVEAIPPS